MPSNLPLVLLLLGGIAAPLAAQTTATPVTVADTETQDRALLAFLDAAYDETTALSPESLTALGSRTAYDRLDDYTEAAKIRRMNLVEGQLKNLRARFDPEHLGPDARLSFRLFERQVEQAREQFLFRNYSFPVSTNGSPAGNIPVLLINRHKVASAADARAYIARLIETERVMREVAATMRDQAAMGIVPPNMVFKPARDDARKVITGAPFDNGPDSTVMADFRSKVSALALPEPEKVLLLDDARAALIGPFRHGFNTLFAVLDEMEPKASGNNGAWSLPNGAAYYQSRLQFWTTTNLTADQIHQLGLERVAAIRTEMEAVKTRIGFTGSLEDFFNVVRTDPKFQYPNTQAGRDAYLVDARAAVADSMTAAPRFFRQLPRAGLEVRAVESWRQDTAASGFYNEPAPDGSRPGIFYVNLADMTQVPKLQVESLAHHEGAPGHHFQFARSQELPNLPKFRRFGVYGAYIEGWGLYAERLAKDMGAYHDPQYEFGMLMAQMGRAIRLVVDTGLHSKRWSREQAVAFFQANSPRPVQASVKEVDRYINGPGQATSYMIGQLKIEALRDKARKALGPKFDIRDFHEAILAHGALPLDELEAQVDRYIARARA